MTEFIGSRISLISKRDIRYVGTLHEISSENSTVALENVISYGTEGRRPEEEIPPNLDNIYEYIVFRGSDVKDLRIEEAPKEQKKPEPPKIPDDPAILGSTRRQKAGGEDQPVQSSPAPDSQSQAPQALPNEQQSQRHENQNQNQNQNRQGQPPQPGQHNQFPPQHFPPYGMPPPNQRFGPGPFPPGPPGHGFQMPPYGAGGWFPPYGMPPHMQGQFPPHQMPQGPPGQFGGPQGFPPGPPGPPPNEASAESKPPAPKPASREGTPTAAVSAATQPPLAETKPDTTARIAATGDAKGGLTAGKNSRLIPAIPKAMKSPAITNGTQKLPEAESKSAPSKSVEDANRDARAAVAAAMAKLPASDKKVVENGSANVDNITRGVQEMRTDGRGRGRGQHRGGHRGGRDDRRVDVPKTDFDFESSNAKFNKHGLVKEAIATGSPSGTPVESTTELPEASAKRGSDAGFSAPVVSGYNKSSSFFDDISSEIKDRADSVQGGQRPGGQEFRREERQKNLETFGQGSVDSFRYGRGRGRGRGGGGYGRGRRGGGGGGRGSYNRGGRESQGPAPIEG